MSITYIVIVNYRRPQDTIECLDSLNLLSERGFKVVLIENGSKDGSAGQLCDHLGLEEGELGKWVTYGNASGHFPIKFIISEENRGFAGGCNIGVLEALSDSLATHVWLLNNDTIVEKSSLSCLLKTFNSDPEFGICGSTLVYHSPSGILQGCGGSFNALTGSGYLIGAHRHREDLPSMDEFQRNANYVIGASLLISVKAIREVGLLYEGFFLYFEELDWCVRVRKMGYKIGWSPTSYVVHKEGASIGTSTTGIPSEKSIFYMTCGYLRYVWKNKRYLIIPAIINASLRAAKWFFLRDFDRSIAVCNGVRDFFSSPKYHKV